MSAFGPVDSARSGLRGRGRGLHDEMTEGHSVIGIPNGDGRPTAHVNHCPRAEPRRHAGHSHDAHTVESDEQVGVALLSVVADLAAGPELTRYARGERRGRLTPGQVPYGDCAGSAEDPRLYNARLSCKP